MKDYVRKKQICIENVNLKISGKYYLGLFAILLKLLLFLRFAPIFCLSKELIVSKNVGVPTVFDI